MTANKTKNTKTLTRDQVESAVEILRQYGLQAFKTASDPVSRGTCLGYSIYATNDADGCVDAAIEMLEQWNGHLSVAAIMAIENGVGTVERKGRDLRITLPEHWNDERRSNREGGKNG